MLLSIASLKGDFGLTAQGHHLSTLDTVPALGFLNTTIRAGGGPRARGLLRMMSTMLSMPRSHPSRSHPRGLWRRGRMKRWRLQRTTVNLFRYLIGRVCHLIAAHLSDNNTPDKLHLSGRRDDDARVVTAPVFTTTRPYR